jgi:molybdenum cofactor cytidylyltransferase
MICALVLAAGESRRMGRPKLLLPFGDKTIIEHVVDNISYSEADKIMLVLGSHREEILNKMTDREVLTAVNHRYREGMLSSIQAGFRALPRKTSGAVICLGDQPLIPSSVIDVLIEAHQKSKKGIILPVYRMRRGHPILIDIRHKQEVLALNPDIGLRALVHHHSQDIQEVEVDTPHILNDIDRPEDYTRDLKEKEKK